jgi:hypothetical protein
MIFAQWITLNEQKWVNFRERQRSSAADLNAAVSHEEFIHYY